MESNYELAGTHHRMHQFYADNIPGLMRSIADWAEEHPGTVESVAVWPTTEEASWGAVVLTVGGEGT